MGMQSAGRTGLKRHYAYKSVLQKKEICPLLQINKSVIKEIEMVILETKLINRLLNK